VRAGYLAKLTSPAIYLVLIHHLERADVPLGGFLTYNIGMKVCKCGCGKEVEKGLNPWFSYQCRDRANRATLSTPKPKRVPKPKVVVKSPVTGRAYPKRGAIIKALVTDAKLQIKIRDDYTCQKCSKKVEGKSCQGSHVIPMSKCRNNALAFDLLNIKVLCAYCHKYFWHSNPIESAKWFEETFPDRHKYLMEHPRTGLKEFELRALYDELKSRV